LKYQISSGQGPAECELTVKRFLEYLQGKYRIEVLRIVEGYNKGIYKSVIFETKDDLSEYIGAIKWVCQSFYRPTHKRKNWFIDFSMCDEAFSIVFRQEEVKYETFRSSGPGGQHVNTTDSGVRAVHIPTGIVSCCTKERSQYMNKKIALKQMEQIFNDANMLQEALEKANMWKNHRQLERGNAVCVFQGYNFKRI